MSAPAPSLVHLDDGQVRLGSVHTWDDGRGVGTLAGDDGTALAFHCTAIADGTRTIPVGARVAYTVVAGRLGGAEAGVVVALGS